MITSTVVTHLEFIQRIKQLLEAHYKHSLDLFRGTISDISECVDGPDCNILIDACGERFYIITPKDSLKKRKPFKKEKYIGLSLSYCVLDIARGLVPYDKVKKISSGTRIKSAADLEIVIDSYKETVWRDYKHACDRICRELFWDRKVYQPRVLNKPTKRNKHKSHWIKCV